MLVKLNIAQFDPSSKLARHMTVQKEDRGDDYTEM